MPFKLDFATPISFEWGISGRLDEMIPARRTTLVLGRNPKRNSAFQGIVEKTVGGDVDIVSGVEPNPSEETVLNGARKISSYQPEQIIAMGGGSVIDAAKVMAIISKHGGSPLQYGSGELTPPDGGYPLYAVPTTPGTSSEITPFAVVSIEEVKNKVGIRHPSLYPSGAIIDPELTVTLPPGQTAATGFDILSHAIESFWSNRSDPISRQFSLGSVSLVRDHLEGAYSDGKIREHREGLSLASVFAGLAFSNTGTTICHSISYPITYDSGLSHGIAVALTLGATFDLLLEKGHPGLDELAAAMGTDPDGFSGEIRRMLDAVDCPVSISGSGFRGGPSRIMETDLTPLLKNMPVPMDESDIHTIIKRSL